MARVVLTLSPAEENSMDKATIELLARRAGLAKALAEFPADVTVMLIEADELPPVLVAVTE